MRFLLSLVLVLYGIAPASADEPLSKPTLDGIYESCLRSAFGAGRAIEYCACFTAETGKALTVDSAKRAQEDVQTRVASGMKPQDAMMATPAMANIVRTCAAFL